MTDQNAGRPADDQPGQPDHLEQPRSTAPGSPDHLEQPSSTALGSSDKPRSTGSGSPDHLDQPASTGSGSPDRLDQPASTGSGSPDRLDQPRSTGTGSPDRPDQSRFTDTGSPDRPDQSRFTDTGSPDHPDEPRFTTSGSRNHPEQPRSTGPGSSGQAELADQPRAADAGAQGQLAGWSGSDRPGPYQGVFGSSGQQPAGPQYDPQAGSERPGPYQGAFGQPAGSSTPPNPPQNASWGQQPNAPWGQQPWGQQPWGQPPGPYGYQPAPVAPPKQVTIASVISFCLGGLCLLLGLFTLTAAGEEIAEMLTGSRDGRSVLAVAILVSSVLYILPAIFVRKRRNWARIMLIVVAAIGIAGGVSALPGSLIGLALHVAILVMMLQQPTKLWFQQSTGR